MKTFKDKNGKTWCVEMSLPARKQVKALLGVDLFAALGSEAEKLGDPEVLGNVLWLFCQEQALAAHISEDDFAKVFDGDAIDAASRALKDEIVSFFPQRQREVMTKALASMEEVNTKALSKLGQATEKEAAKILELLDDPEFFKKITSAPTKSSESSSNSPESPDLIPTESAFEN